MRTSPSAFTVNCCKTWCQAPALKAGANLGCRARIQGSTVPTFLVFIFTAN